MPATGSEADDSSHRNSGGKKVSHRQETYMFVDTARWRVVLIIPRGEGGAAATFVWPYDLHQHIHVSAAAGASWWSALWKAICWV